ncbi:MAG: hypothetical protein RR539_09200 [Clostridium sp.]|uniref:hypothetical protein n=1 Tax=Clostridium sp. TaxID=1506 RepID=UPI002FC7129C
MRKLYIGILVSIIFILGGSVFYKFYRPEVKSEVFNEAFYNKAKYIRHSQFWDNLRFVSADKNSIKIVINFNDMNGSIASRDIFEAIKTTAIKSTQGEAKRNQINEFFSSKNVKKEVFKFKWLTKPKNIDIVKETEEKIIKKSPYEGTGEASYQEFYKIHYESYRGKESGSFDIEKGEGSRNRTVFYGIGGSGTLEIEVVNVYK